MFAMDDNVSMACARVVRGIASVENAVILRAASARTVAPFRSGISEMNGSAEVVENVAKTSLGLGYSGMGYKTPNVNWLKVSNKKGEPGIEPGTDVARTGKYPIARKLYLYTAGEPTGEVKAYIDWILSPTGQKIVEQEGFVPLK